jgi:hypothetical protein
MRFMGSSNPIWQVRVNNLEAGLSRNTKKDSILTKNTPAPDVQLEYTRMALTYELSKIYQ